MSKTPAYMEIDGMKMGVIFVPQLYRDATNFKPGKDDVIVVTYPKCGTTWATQIAALVLRKGGPLMTSEEYFSFIPFIETTPMEQISKMVKPRLIKTHIPFDRLNISPEAKYIYVARHPADCVVSYYYHTQLFPCLLFTNGTLDELFEVFIKGEIQYNDYFDHLLCGYELRNEPNVLFLTYESMKEDHRSACLKIARFLGEEYYKILLENDEAVLKKVLEYSSLEFMKSTVNNFMQGLFTSVPSEEAQKANPVLRRVARVLQEAEQRGEKSKGTFVRRGVVGEGKSALSEDQWRRLNDRIHEKTANSDVMSLWKEN